MVDIFYLYLLVYILSFLTQNRQLMNPEKRDAFKKAFRKFTKAEFDDVVAPIPKEERTLEDDWEITCLIIEEAMAIASGIKSELQLEYLEKRIRRKASREK